jgi:F0F1-type ATP synthase membrane subunit c/vacuolar-type H+-ATPase subunit K
MPQIGVFQGGLAQKLGLVSASYAQNFCCGATDRVLTWAPKQSSTFFRKLLILLDIPSLLDF